MNVWSIWTRSLWFSENVTDVPYLCQSAARQRQRSRGTQWSNSSTRLCWSETQVKMMRDEWMKYVSAGRKAQSPQQRWIARSPHDARWRRCSARSDRDFSCSSTWTKAVSVRPESLKHWNTTPSWSRAPTSSSLRVQTRTPHLTNTSLTSTPSPAWCWVQSTYEVCLGRLCCIMCKYCASTSRQRYNVQ